MKSDPVNPRVEDFLAGKSPHTLSLYDHFISEFEKIAPIQLHATKTMIAIGAPEKRVAWVTQLGKNFIHVVFPLSQPYYDNLCFQKVAQVPGSNQYNHHFRMLFKEDVNDEVVNFMKLALENG